MSRGSNLPAAWAAAVIAADDHVRCNNGTGSPVVLPPLSGSYNDRRLDLSGPPATQRHKLFPAGRGSPGSKQSGLSSRSSSRMTWEMFFHRNPYHPQCPRPCLRPDLGLSPLCLLPRLPGNPFEPLTLKSNRGQGRGGMDGRYRHSQITSN